jgi:ABC-type sugar transport system permease subunit
MSLEKDLKLANLKSKKKTKASLDARKARAGYVFVLPFIISFIVIYIPIIVNSITFSFSKINLGRQGGYTLENVGFENFVDAFTKEVGFLQTLSSGIQQLIFDIPAIVIFSLFMAVLLNQKMVGRAAFRAIFFIPVILSTGIIESIDSENNIFMNYVSTEGGDEDGAIAASAGTQIISALDLKGLFTSMKVGGELVEYVINLINDIYNIINRSGVQMLIFLAGLQSISPAIYESCEIDGASAWETFWKITLPMISPMILVNAIYTVIDAFTAESNSVMRYIENIQSDEIGTAMSWMYFLLVVLIIGVVAALLGAFVFYQKRD